jgi:hypothetical protein
MFLHGYFDTISISIRGRVDVLLASYKEVENIAGHTAGSFVEFCEATVFTGNSGKFIGLHIKNL